MICLLLKTYNIKQRVFLGLLINMLIHKFHKNVDGDKKPRKDKDAMALTAALAAKGKGKGKGKGKNGKNQKGGAKGGHVGGKGDQSTEICFHCERKGREKARFSSKSATRKLGRGKRTRTRIIRRRERRLRPLRRRTGQGREQRLRDQQTLGLPPLSPTPS